MDFSVEFYEIAAGTCPVRAFLDELKASDLDDFAAVVAGLAKLRRRQYHREPLSRRLATGCSSCATWASSIPVCCGSSRSIAGSSRCTASATKARPSRFAISIRRGNGCVTGRKERSHEKDQFQPIPRRSNARPEICRPL